GRATPCRGRNAGWRGLCRPVRSRPRRGDGTAGAGALSIAAGRGRLMTARSFHVEAIEYAAGLAELRAVRETVFVHEQQVPLEEEWDALDPLCRHVIARDQAGA